MKFSNLQFLCLQHITNRAQIICLDLETNPKDHEFLTSERILAIGISRRISGAPCSSDGIETKIWMLEKNNDENEIELLRVFSRWLKTVVPMVVVGANIRGYDLPLLSYKLERYKNSLLADKWGLVDLLERPINIEMIHLFKEHGVNRLGDIVDLPEYSRLPFRRTKNLFPERGEEKMNAIQDAWINDQGRLAAYLEGDVNDCLLTMERMQQLWAQGELL